MFTLHFDSLLHSKSTGMERTGNVFVLFTSDVFSAGLASTCIELARTELDDLVNGWEQPSFISSSDLDSTTIPCSAFAFSDLSFTTLSVFSTGKAPLIFASFNFANSLSGKEKSTIALRKPPLFVCSEEGLGKTKPSVCISSARSLCVAVSDTLHFVTVSLLHEGVSFFVLECFDLALFVLLTWLLSWKTTVSLPRLGVDCSLGDLLGNSSSNKCNQCQFCGETLSRSCTEEHLWASSFSKESFTFTEVLPSLLKISLDSWPKKWMSSTMAVSRIGFFFSSPTITSLAELLSSWYVVIIEISVAIPQ